MSPNRPQPSEPTDRKSLYWIWWVIGALVQTLLTLPAVFRQIHWRALGITAAVFIASMFILENVAIYYGWWIWNEQKLLGLHVLLVPLEEFLLYFVAVPSVITLLALWEKFWQARLKED